MSNKPNIAAQVDQLFVHIYELLTNIETRLTAIEARTQNLDLTAHAAENGSDSEHSPQIMLGALLCRIPQAAALVGRGERWVYEALADGRIQGVKSDGRTLIVIASLHEYVASLPPAKIKAMRQSKNKTKRSTDRSISMSSR
jgi:hypothetical protein